MNIVKSLVVATVLLATSQASNASVRISDDRGGRIGKYLERYDAIRASGETVVIDGECLSACTMILGAVSADKLCVTPRASLGFHAAYNLGTKGQTIANAEATELLYSHYPSSIQRWIESHGGLRSHMIFLRGKELVGMYPRCRS